MINALSFILILVGLILAHEIGHLIMAKRAGVKVQEFGVGFPPRLVAIRRGETEYSLNALPLGGFVRMLGEEDPTEPGSLASKTVTTRLAVLAAGAVMNGLLAVGLFAVSFMIPQETTTGQVQIVAVASGSPAEMAGLRPGEIIRKINDRPIKNVPDLIYNIQLNLGSEMKIVVSQGPLAQRELRVVPRWNPPAGQGATGIQIAMANAYKVQQSYPIWEAIPLGLQRSVDMFTLTRNEIIGMILRRTAPQVAGPIGIYQLTGEVAKIGLGALIELAALLSINLAIINLFPIPMLDGGRMVFVAIEGLRGGKRIPPEKEGLVHLMGLIFILALVAIISYYDILRIINAEGVLR